MNAVYYVLGYGALYFVSFFILGSIEHSIYKNEKVLLKYLMLQPVLLFVIPIAFYFLLPTHSIPFALFIAGRLLSTFYGVRDTSDILNTPAFQRHYGGIINVLSWLLSMIGMGWGAYNLFLK